MAGRPRTALGTHGKISTRKIDGGRWEALTRHRDRDGVLRKVKATGSTKAKTEGALKKKISERVHVASNGTLKAETPILKAADVWLDQVRRSDRAETTVKLYEGNVRRYVKGSSIQGLTVREVNDVAVIESYLQGIADTNGEGAARGAKKIVSGILSLAVRYGVISANAAKEAVPPKALKPKGKGARDTRRAFTRDERDHLIETADADEKAAILDVADLLAYLAGTGCRIGEALRQRWEDVNLADGTVHVRGTKSDAGDRVLHLPSWLTQRLAGRDCTTGLVFPSPGVRKWRDKKGKVHEVHRKMDPCKVRDERNVYEEVRRLMDSAGFPWATSHTLRRTTASLMDQAGVPIAVAANQLGHSNPAMTASVYLGRKGGAAIAADVL